MINRLKHIFSKEGFYWIYWYIIKGTRFDRLISDIKYIKLQYRLATGKKLNLDSPRTFNEKVQWMKLFDRKPIYTEMVDKKNVKKLVTEIIGGEYVIKTLAVYKDVNEIEWDNLPNQFVLKCTHDSGGISICKDKSSFDYENAKRILKRALKKKHFWHAREWAYKNVNPSIIAEEYLEDSTDGELRDYKFYCFNGEPHYLLLATGRQDKVLGLRFDYYDMDYKHLNLTNNWHPNAVKEPHKPINFEKMKTLARMLSSGIPQVRVDFYEANGKIYFGEMTFYDMGGCLIIHPANWDMEWGSLIKL